MDTGGLDRHQETDVGNWEVWELFVPEIYMSRMMEPYSVGCGRYRSGLSMPTMDMLHRVTVGIGSGAIGCAHDRIIPNLGLFGGYPGGKRNTFLVRYHDFRDTVNKRLPLIHEIGDPRTFMDYPYAEVRRLNHMPPTIEVKDKDAADRGQRLPGRPGRPHRKGPGPAEGGPGQRPHQPRHHPQDVLHRGPLR